MKKEENEVGSYLKDAAKYFKSNNLYDSIGYSVMRFLNYLFLILFILAIVSSRFLREEINIENSYLILIFIVSPTLASIIIYISKRKHTFLIWDKVEREKYESFSNKLTFLVCFFTYLSMFVFSISINDYKFDTFNRNDIIGFGIGIFYGILFMANAIFSIQLCYNLYKNDLLQDNYVANKPNNWEWDSSKL
jgi:hypothetical protein